MCIIENKIQLSKCGDLTGFIRLYMNWAAFHLAAERALHGILQMEEFYGTEEGGQGVYQQKKKKSFIVRPRYLFSGAWETARALSLKLPLLPMGDGVVPRDRLSHWC